MSKFKVGQKVYCILRGLGEVVAFHQDIYPVNVAFEKGKIDYYMKDGRRSGEYVNPVLLTLEEARAKGYDVPKQKIVKEKTLYVNLYRNKCWGTYESEYDAKQMNGDLLTQAYPVTIKYEIEE